MRPEAAGHASAADTSASTERIRRHNAGRTPGNWRKATAHVDAWEATRLLERKNAVVNGAAGAVGSAVAEAFAREGARALLSGRDLAQMQRLAEKINEAGGHAEARQLGPRADLETRRHQW